jgi:DNA-binding NtrC family response regulator
MQQVRVLLIDDEEPFVQTMVKRLTRRSCDVQYALSGQDGLKALEELGNTEVVILDVKMPGMDGIETLREIKKEFPLVEVVMLTGHATVESAIEGMKRGAFDYLMKPCDIETLVLKIEEAAARKRAQDEKIEEARIKEIVSRRV